LGAEGAQRLKFGSVHLRSMSERASFVYFLAPPGSSWLKGKLRCPKDYQFRTLFGFSPPIPELFGFGKTVHTSVGKLHERFANQAPSIQEAENIARSTFHLKHVPPSSDPINRPGAYERAKDSAAKLVTNYTTSYSADFRRRKEVEWPFEVAVSRGVISGAIDLMLRDDGRGNILDANVIDFKATRGPDPEEEQEEFYWTELALQVQLYAQAARTILGERANNGAVHFLRDDQRVLIPIQTEAVDAAIQNVEWAIDRIIDQDFPMRPHPRKCEACDFKQLCGKKAEPFKSSQLPPPIFVPSPPNPTATEMARAFSQFQNASPSAQRP
jgi:DNA helicase-2/ATP-dependent DNA helicase PcrA